MHAHTSNAAHPQAQELPTKFSLFPLSRFSGNLQGQKHIRNEPAREEKRVTSRGQG